MISITEKAKKELVKVLSNQKAEMLRVIFCTKTLKLITSMTTVDKALLFRKMVKNPAAAKE